MVAAGNNTPDSHVHLDGMGVHSSLPLNFFMDRYTESYLREMRAFVEAVQGGAAVPVTGHDGFMAVAIGLAAAQSVRENRPVPLSEVRVRRVTA
jgi:myo-inositol 2-dehydrogenase/D-chiro-inositol 1-dehydrogenase